MTLGRTVLLTLSALAIVVVIVDLTGVAKDKPAPQQSAPAAAPIAEPEERALPGERESAPEAAEDEDEKEPKADEVDPEIR